MLLSNMNNIGVYDATSRNIVETVGGAGNSSSQKKWGLSSLFFDGSGDYLRIFDSPINRLRQSAFTIEFWVYFNAVRAQGIVARGSGSTGWIISTNLYLNLEFITASGSIVSAQVLPIQTWLHIAVVREGLGTNQTKLYINGITDGIGTSTQDFNDANTMYIGADKTGGNNAYLYMQDLRITKVARYTNNFNPPTSPFPLL
ncbi:MAG: LamG domain-containing protein [Bacteroidetes bacterium]|nr:LamG domain-containing protein [Bacteroidota bacterium]